MGYIFAHILFVCWMTTIVCKYYIGLLLLKEIACDIVHVLGIKRFIVGSKDFLYP